MPSSDIYNCRVCGLRLDDPPWSHDGCTPLYDYCPCCGVEFGYQDATPPGARRYREEWLNDGAIWSEPSEMPTDWNRVAQFGRIPDEFR